MVNSYRGHYFYNRGTIANWKSSAIGVYYCGFITTEGNLKPLYIGSGTSKDGIRGRLLYHLEKDVWPDATYFGYCLCDTVEEAKKWEEKEIAKYKPKYNKIGV